MPALLTSTSTDLKRDSAVSTILAAVAGSPMWPSTRATWLEATTSVDWVTLRELATTLKPRSTNAFTIPAPIPRDAPVTMAVFRVLMIVYLETDFSQVEKIPFTGISFKSGFASVIAWIVWPGTFQTFNSKSNQRALRPLPKDDRIDGFR